MMTFWKSGSGRRFAAFLAALAALVTESKTHLDSTTITAIVTLSLGYIGQGSMKEFHLAKVEASKVAS